MKQAIFIAIIAFLKMSKIGGSMKSIRDFEPSVQCDECDKYLLIGDNPNNPILETCDDCVREQKTKMEVIL
jgi:hypothetical protein